MVGVDALLGLGVEPDRLAVEQEAHHVDVVRGEIQHDPHVPDASGERTQARRLDLEDAPKLSPRQPAPELTDGRIEPLDVAHRQQPTSLLCGFDHGLRIGAVRGDRLLD